MHTLGKTHISIDKTQSSEYIYIERARCSHLKLGASISPPISITQSGVSFMSGSKPRLPPGEDSNIKPKSRYMELKQSKSALHTQQMYLEKRRHD